MQIGSAEILTLPRNPKVSIIILTLNQTDYLRKNLESIESKTTYKNYEIIIVTNNRGTSSGSGSSGMSFATSERPPVDSYLKSGAASRARPVTNIVRKGFMTE